MRLDSWEGKCRTTFASSIHCPFRPVLHMSSYFSTFLAKKASRRVTILARAIPAGWRDGGGFFFLPFTATISRWRRFPVMHLRLTPLFGPGASHCQGPKINDVCASFQTSGGAELRLSFAPSWQSQKILLSSIDFARKKNQRSPRSKTMED